MLIDNDAQTPEVARALEEQLLHPLPENADALPKLLRRSTVTPKGIACDVVACHDPYEAIGTMKQLERAGRNIAAIVCDACFNEEGRKPSDEGDMISYFREGMGDFPGGLIFARHWSNGKIHEMFGIRSRPYFILRTGLTFDDRPAGIDAFISKPQGLHPLALSILNELHRTAAQAR